MKQAVWTVVATALICSSLAAQDFSIGGPTAAANEPLFQYDDQEVWKHGWLQIMPYYGGYHSYRPYNYKHVFAQSAQSAAWGMSPTMPYSQQFWHRYEHTSGPGQAMSFQGMAPAGPVSQAWAAAGQYAASTRGDAQVAPTSFEQLHMSPAAGPELQRQSLQKMQMQHYLRQSVPPQSQPQGWTGGRSVR